MVHSTKTSLWSCLFVVAYCAACLIGSVGASSSSTTTTVSSSRDGLQPVNAMCANSVANLVKQAASAYAVNNALAVTVSSQSDPVVMATTFLAGGNDFGVGGQAFTTEQQTQYPQYAAYPMIASAIVPVYNLGSVGLVQLVLPIDVICDIELAVITNWNNTRISSVNHLLTIPNLPITVFHLGGSSSPSLAVTTMCGKISTAFATQVPASLTPNWPIPNYAAFAFAKTSDMLASMVVDTAGGFGMATMQNVLQIQSGTIAAIRNSAGVTVLPTLNAISLNILELGASGVVGKATLDLTNPKSQNAWPIVTMTYLWIDLTYAVTTCATKTAVLNFLLYFYTDTAPTLLAEGSNMVIVPSLFLDAIDLLDVLKTSVTCQSQQLVTTAASTGFIEGFNSAASLMTSYASYYQSVDSTYSYTFVSATEQLATYRVVASEVDLAVVNTRQLSTDDIALMTDGGAGIFVPALMTGVSVTFTLPIDFTNAYATWSATTSTLPDLYPLQLDMETIALIFVGELNYWTDPPIAASNPQLAAWFAKYPVSTLFTTVVCCSDKSDPMVASQLLLQGLNGTATAQSSNYSSYFAQPISWAQQIATAPNFYTIDREARMMPNAESVQMTGGSSITYELITGAAADRTSQFQIVQTISGVTESIEAVPRNFVTCAQEGSTLGRLADPTYIPQPIAGCYPLSTALSIGVDLTYTGTDYCTSGNKSLNFYSWITNSDALSGAANNAGLMRLADLDDIQASTNVILNSATCDGATLLITLPTVWAVNSAISGFGIAVLVMGLLTFTVSAVLLFYFRHRTVLRSSSVPFLGLILVGLTMMVIAVAAWASGVSAGTCGSFMWLGSLGFSLVFVPFFAKTYRIYMIFSRQKLKVVKMSNKKLMIAVAAMIGAELALLTSWSLVSPLKPITYIRNISGTYHQAALCSVDTNGMRFVIVEVVYKGCMLIGGTMLAFSTRKVSSAFNESSAIAFSIYNVLFSSVIIGGIIYFVSAFEDTLILLILFLLFWVTLVTWGLLFGQKFFVMFSQSEEDASVMSKLSSLQTEKSAGFSFVSVIGMSAAMIKSYVGALELQLTKARKQLTVVLGSTGQGLGIGVGNASAPKQRLAAPTVSQKYVKSDLGLEKSLLPNVVEATDDSPVIDELERDCASPSWAAPNHHGDQATIERPHVLTTTRASSIASVTTTPASPSQSTRIAPGGHNATSPERIVPNKRVSLHIQASGSSRDLLVASSVTHPTPLTEETILMQQSAQARSHSPQGDSAADSAAEGDSGSASPVTMTNTPLLSSYPAVPSAASSPSSASAPAPAPIVSGVPVSLSSASKPSSRALQAHHGRTSSQKEP